MEGEWGIGMSGVWIYEQTRKGKGDGFDGWMDG